MNISKKNLSPNTKTKKVMELHTAAISVKSVSPKKKSEITKASKPAKFISDKTKKQKVVRDSFTMPKVEYEEIAMLKARCISAGTSVKKSELLRAGIFALSKLSDAVLLEAIAALKNVRTGRPLSNGPRCG